MKKSFISQASLPPSPQARGRKGKGDKEKEKGDKDKGEEREKKKRKIRLEMHNDQVINLIVYKLIDKNDGESKAGASNTAKRCKWEQDGTEIELSSTRHSFSYDESHVRLDHLSK